MEEVDLMAKISIGTIPENDFAQYDTYLDYPHLFKSINDDFTTTGFILSDATSVLVTNGRNTLPTLQMTYPRDGIHVLEIQKDRYLLEDADYKFTHQIFKITHVIQELDDVVVEAEHIGSTLNDSTVPEAIQLNDATPQDLMNQVFNTMQPQRVFTFNSNVTTARNVNIEKGQQAGSILLSPDQEGDTATQSVLGLWGGELQFDNFDIYHDDHLGHDTNIVITYGRNIKEFSHDVNTENMWTGAVFTATYTPGQAVATESNVDWSSWDGSFSGVASAYLAGGAINIYDSPVEGQQIVGTLTDGMKLNLGKAVHNGDMTPDGKYQINTVNGDDWYPIQGGGWVDANWITFDTSGDYLVNNVSGDVTVQADNPYEESGAGSRVSMSGTAVVAYKPGGSIHVYYSPEIGNDHIRTGVTFKNGSVIHYDMIERNQNGDVWYRIGDHQWLYGPHLSTSQEDAYRSYTNSGYGYIKPNQPIYHWSKKKKKMVATTKTTVVAKSKSKKSKNHWKSKKKTVKVPAKKGRTVIDRTVIQGGVTYMHTTHGWVKSGSIDYTKNGSVKPKSWSQIINQQVKDHSKVEIYKTPNSKDALNWSIPNGTTSANNSDFKVLGHEAKGGDGKTYVEVSYKGKTGWLMEDNISDKSTLNSADDDLDEDSDADGDSDANVDQSQKEVTVTVGPIYADGFGIDPNVDKVNSVDLSSNFKHDDQDLSGQQADGTFVATQADIDQLTQLGQQYVIEHKYGHPEVQDTISYEEMSGINADWTQLGVYDFVTAYSPQYDISERAEVNTTVWDALNQRYTQISIGKEPETWQHLMQKQIESNTNERISSVSQKVTQVGDFAGTVFHALKLEGTSREQAFKELAVKLGDAEVKIDANGKKYIQMNEDMKVFGQHMQEMATKAQQFGDWIKNGGSNGAILYPRSSDGSKSWNNVVEIDADGGDHQMVFNNEGLGWYDSGGGFHAGIGWDGSEGKLLVDEAIIPKLDASHIDCDTIHSLGTIEGTLRVDDYDNDSDYYTQVDGGSIDIAGGGSHTQISDAIIETDGTVSAGDMITDQITNHDGRHVIWTQASNTTLGGFIKDHWKKGSWRDYWSL